VILLVADPSLAAKKRRHDALPSRGSTLKNRVWGFESIPSGLTCSGPGSSWENAAGCVQYSYKNASGRTEFLQTDPIRFAAGDVNIYRYCGNNPLNLTDATGQGVTVLLNQNAVSLPGGPAGHVGEIVGNDQSGYTYNSYGPTDGEFSTGQVTSQSFSNYGDAMNYAANQGYTNYANYSTTSAQDAAANNAAQQYNNSTYIAPGNDCKNMVNDSMNAAGINTNNSSLYPNSFYNQNSPNANSTGTFGPPSSSSPTGGYWYDPFNDPFQYSNNNGCPDANVA
jgi:RHS repeat-associated protein